MSINTSVFSLSERGSIWAAIPAVAFALVDHGLVIAVWIIVWYVIFNTIIGNIFEPRLMGKGLGLSPLVIVLSMIFWELIFGPAGMILSVLLTMVSQYLFDQYKETRWIGVSRPFSFFMEMNTDFCFTL